MPKKKHPLQQVRKALQGPMTAPKQDEEDLVDHCKRFMSLNLMVDRAHGKIVPVAVAKKNMTAHGKDPSGTMLAHATVGFP